MSVDSAILSLLSLDAATATSSSAGGGGCSTATTSKIIAKLPDGSTTAYFVKTGSGDEAVTMFRGEHESLNALAAAVPGLAPKSFGHGKLAQQSDKSFLVTEFLDMSGGRAGSKTTLAAKLAQLHTTPAPVPKGYDQPQFGFPVKTCCGNTSQKNSYHPSWAKFYADCRLRFIVDRSSSSNGRDDQLVMIVNRVCNEVVPRLIGDDHINNGKGIQPVVVHGDLWSGNAGFGKLPGMSQAEDVIYDSSACYAHSEYELGIMKMFGGFGGSFIEEYHKLKPKDEPVEEYDDRVALYELYHHLNHYAMFGGSYKSGATQIMHRLLKKYGAS
ncbi:hypothetical protein AMS68_003866 [Peltaster fructicola]|uniref:protein-ribulosamine 3-kinase n=1 Tax=Peltaster fructicola TaxID=286661 RepID=A0A6H0XUP8_9PEZI|nr:hypothetical protein AMS68_003866 [Peltaster fructicola]